MILKEQNARLHQLLSKLGMMDEKINLVRQYTSGRSSSSKDLTHHEARELIQHLENYERSLPRSPRSVPPQTGRRGEQSSGNWQAPANLEEGFQRNIKSFDRRDPKNSNESRAPMRRYILHLAHMMHLVDTNTRGPYRYNYDRLNRLIENLGANNPRKVQLNFLSYYELAKVCTQVEQIYRKQMHGTDAEIEKSINKSRKEYGI